MADGGGAPMGKLQGLFEWSMKYQRGDNGNCSKNDNNNNSTGGAEAADPAAREAAIRRAAAEFTPERRAFLEKALAEYTRDHAQRMREIKEVLDAGEGGDGATSEAAAAAAAAAPGAATAAATTKTTTTAADIAQKAELLDELHEIVENIDHARDLVKVGGLPTLLRLLRSPHASLRWRAADVLAASAANNPPVQRWLLESGALPPLMALLELSAEAAAFPSDGYCDLVRARTKAVHALSAIVRHHDGGFGAFRERGGLAQLARLEGASSGGGAGGGAGDDDDDADDDAQLRVLRRRLLRKELELLRYALAREPGDCAAAAGLGAAERAAAGAGLAEEGAEAVDAELRAAALAVLLEMAQHPAAWRELRERCPGLGERLSRGGGGEEEPDAALARELAARIAPWAEAPKGVKPGLRDHIDLDPHDQQAGSGAAHKSIPLKKQQLQQLMQEQQQAGGGSVAAAAAAEAAAAAKKPTLSLGAP